MISSRREWIFSAGLMTASAIGQPCLNGQEITGAEQRLGSDSGGLFHPQTFGARADGVSNDTDALQAAINAAAQKGGGTIHITAGRYLCGTLRLRDRVSLWLDNGATLVMSLREEDFPPTETSNPADTKSNETSPGLLVGDGIRNVAVYGEGIIEGNRSRRGGPKPVFLRDCTEIALRGITFRNAPNYTVSLFRCRNVVIENIAVLNGYADGIDLDCCRHVRISNCLVESVDDAICLKASQPYSKGGVTAHITLSNCTLRTASIHFKCGTESCGDFHSIAVSNCTLEGGMGLRHGNPGIALYTVDGGNLEDVVFSNIVMQDVATPFAIILGNRDAWHLGQGPGRLRGVRICNVIANGASFPSVFAGLPGHPIREIDLSDITVRVATSFKQTSLRGADDMAAIPENPGHYPEPTMFGPLPAFGMYLRHIEQAEFHRVRLLIDKDISFPAIVGDDLSDLYLDLPCIGKGISAQFHALRNSFVQIVAPGRHSVPIVRIGGSSTTDVLCRIHSGRNSKSQVLLDDDLVSGAVEIL